MAYVVVYVAGPALGGFFAAMFHKMFHERAIVAADEAKDTEYNKMVAQ